MKIKLMEVCGTHTMAIARSGIKKFLPDNIELVSGPGCPVCVTPQYDIDVAIAISRIPDVIMTTFGDMLRVPGTLGSLDDAKRDGRKVRIVYSPLDALDIAINNPKNRIVFMGVGFETTSPTVAATIREAKKKGIRNFFVLSNFKVLFPALNALSKSKDLKIDGFICPGHVSVITGSAPYEGVVRRYKKACVITGFEVPDILKGIEMLIQQIKKRSFKVEIAYERAVTYKGNERARWMLQRVFKERDSEWRGLGIIRKSGLKLGKGYKMLDAEKEFKVKIKRTTHPRACICGEVLRGAKTPPDCKMFVKKCTPETPIGPCMVSSEGTCAAYFKYGK